jgi:hypothetical protein
MITEADLHRALDVLLQFEIRDGQLVAVPPTTNLADSRGVRRTDNLIQFGLTGPEIREIYRRLTGLLRDVDSGKVKVF